MPRHGDGHPQPADEPVEHDHPRPADDPRRRHLGNLGSEIEKKTELRARVVSPSRSGTGTTTLRVVNPYATHLYVDIGCDLLDREWWFTWDLSEDGTLGPATGLSGAVAVIDKVLMVKI